LIGVRRGRPPRRPAPGAGRGADAGGADGDRVHSAGRVGADRGGLERRLARRLRPGRGPVRDRPAAVATGAPLGGGPAPKRRLRGPRTAGAASLALSERADGTDSKDPSWRRSTAPTGG